MAKPRPKRVPLFSSDEEEDFQEEDEEASSAMERTAGLRCACLDDLRAERAQFEDEEQEQAMQKVIEEQDSSSSEEDAEKVDSGLALLAKLREFKGKAGRRRSRRKAPTAHEPPRPGLVPKRRPHAEYALDVAGSLGGQHWSQTLTVMASIQRRDPVLVLSAVKKLDNSRRLINYPSCGDMMHHPGAEGHTPLTYAALLGDLEVCKLLVDTVGARTDARNEYGQTPLAVAEDAGHTDFEVVDFLRARSGLKALDRKAEANRAARKSQRDAFRAQREAQENAVRGAQERKRIAGMSSQQRERHDAKKKKEEDEYFANNSTIAQRIQRRDPYVAPPTRRSRPSRTTSDTVFDITATSDASGLRAIYVADNVPHPAAKEYPERWATKSLTRPLWGGRRPEKE